MDILLLQASAYELPTSRRVGVVVHDGATDGRIWPGPGSDRDLVANYGPDLQQTLDREIDALPDAELSVGGLVRLHPGRLHCDFLVWIGSRPPEEGGRQAPAPTKETLDASVRDVLDFVSERDVIRIAFPALGAGPSAVEDADRLAIIARACGDWYEKRFASGKATPIEEVLICDPRLAVVTSARKQLRSLVKVPAEPKPPSAEKPAEPKRERRTRATTSSKKPKLDEAELAYARTTAQPWDRSHRYGIHQWFIHSKFGVGQVREVTNDKKIVVLFEDGEIRTLVHDRA